MLTTNICYLLANVTVFPATVCQAAMSCIHIPYGYIFFLCFSLTLMLWQSFPSSKARKLTYICWLAKVN